MMQRKKMWRLVLVIVMVMGLFTACSDKEKAQTSKADTGKEAKKSLVIGLDDTFAPMGFRDAKNELVGFDVELAQAIAEKNQWQIRFQPIDWAMKEQELQSGNIDMIWNGYTITDSRKEKVSFTDAYLANRQILVVLKDSKVQKMSDLAGKSVALQAESSALEAVRRNKSFAESLKEVPEYPTNTEVFKDLEIGRVDAIAVDEVMARYYMKTNGQEKYRVLEENLGEEEFGIGVRKTDEELRNALNEGLKTMKENGIYASIYSKWFSEN